MSDLTSIHFIGSTDKMNNNYKIWLSQDSKLNEIHKKKYYDSPLILDSIHGQFVSINFEDLERLREVSFM